LINNYKLHILIWGFDRCEGLVNEIWRKNRCWNRLAEEIPTRVIFYNDDQ